MKRLIISILLAFAMATVVGCSSSTTNDAAPVTPAQVPTTISFSAGDVFITGTLASADVSLGKGVAKSGTTDEEYDIYAINGLNFFNKETSAVVYEGTFVDNNFYLPVPAGQVYALVIENSSGQKAYFEHPSLDLSSVPVFGTGLSNSGTIEIESVSTSISSGKRLLQTVMAAAPEIPLGNVTFRSSVTDEMSNTIPVDVEVATFRGDITDEDFHEYAGFGTDEEAGQHSDLMYASLVNLMNDWNEDGITDYEQNIYNLFRFEFSQTSLAPAASLVNGVYDDGLFTSPVSSIAYENTWFEVLLDVWEVKPSYTDLTLKANYDIITYNSNTEITTVYEGDEDWDGEGGDEIPFTSQSGEWDNIYGLFGGGTGVSITNFAPAGAIFEIKFNDFTYGAGKGLNSVLIGPIAEDMETEMTNITIVPSITFTGTPAAITGVSIQWVKVEDGVKTNLTDEEVVRNIHSGTWVSLNYDSNYFVTPEDRSDYNQVDVIGTDDIDWTTSNVTISASETFNIQALGYLYISVIYQGGITKTFTWR